MLIVLFRTLILYLLALFVIRVMGKGELSKMDPFQLVILIMIAELAAMPIESTDVSIITGITAMLALLFLQVLFSWISMRSEGFNALISGRPCILINNGDLNEKELRRLRINISDLAEQLRLKNFPSIADVEYAVLESNGDLSVVPKAGKKPATPEDSGVLKPREALPVTLVANGQLSRAGLRLTGRTESALWEELKKQGFRDYNEILFCYRDEQDSLHVYPREGMVSRVAETPRSAAGKKEEQ